MKDITFFIENESHYRFVSPLLKYFDENNYKIDVICQESLNDERRFSKNTEFIKASSDVEKIKLLSNCESKLFFTTTPGIGQSFFPKSKVLPKPNRPVYIYLFHSLVSPNEMYTKNSFYYFDYILSPSITISEQIKFIVSKKTKIFTTGYLLFDSIKPFKNIDFEEKVLVAPTWEMSSVKQIISELNKIVTFNEIETIFRPHPMTNLSDLSLNPNIVIDNNLSLDDLGTYKLLITDFSGIALEFFYLTGRPVAFLDTPKKIKRKISKKEKGLNLIEDEMRTEIGEIFRISNFENILDREIKLKNPEYVYKINHSSNALQKSIDYLETIYVN